MTSRQQELVKWIAVGAMLVDHVGALFLSGDAQYVARAVGRLAFPLFALLLAYNVGLRGVPWSRYIRPLVVFSLVSQFPYAAAFGLEVLNIFPTLLAGVLLIAAATSWWRFTAAVIGVVVLGPVLMYGAVGAFVVFLFWGAFRVGGWAWGALALALLLLNGLHPVGLVVILVGPVVWLVVRSGWGVRRSPSWWFWWFYPGHLAALVLLRLVVGSGSP